MPNPVAPASSKTLHNSGNGPLRHQNPYSVNSATNAITIRLGTESGQVRYKANDVGYPTDEVSNCIHSISDLAVDEARLRVAIPGWGEMASYLITRLYIPMIIDTCQTHDWLIRRLCLDKYCLQRQSLTENPTRGFVLRSVRDVMYQGRPSVKGCACLGR